jgi:glycosyltransferase involved in cell wall biosynthesis
VLFRSPSIDVLFLNWRDVSHPEGGGSERYVHRVAEGLAARGLSVEMFCAAHDRAPREEVLRGVRMVRRGGRLGVYPRALLHVLRRRPRVVVEVQNGLPFGSPLVTRRPVVALVHHVHREQWPIVFGRLGGAVGWWLESVVAPRLHRRSSYVTVSRATAEELSALGVAAERITVVPNGLDPVPLVPVPRTPEPRLLVLGRLVPHKRVEHALAVLARLRQDVPDLRLVVVGEGWWEDALRAEAARLGVADAVEFTGFLDEPAKHRELAGAQVHLCPSVKEGWGLVVTEAGAHGVPTVGYRSAGGLRESVLDGRTGLLVDDLDELTAAVRRLLEDTQLRQRMGAAAAAYAGTFSWAATAEAFAGVVTAQLGGSGVVGSVVPGDVRGGAARGAVRVDARLDPEDGCDGEHGADCEGDQCADEGLHRGARFRRGRRRSGTVDGGTKIHNTAVSTAPSALP